MGLPSSFNTERQNFDVNAAGGRLSVDLTKFIIGSTPLGKEPWDGDFFAKHFEKNTTLKSERDGYELGVEEGLLDYAFLTLENFQGIFLIQDKSIPLSTATTTTKEDIFSNFGEPYWSDLDDGEIILFYEFQEGTIELQFEFPNSEHLEFITLMKDGVLSKEEQRKSYGVTKPSPPEKKE